MENKGNTFKLIMNILILSFIILYSLSFWYYTYVLNHEIQNIEQEKCLFDDMVENFSAEGYKIWMMTKWEYDKQRIIAARYFINCSYCALGILIIYNSHFLYKHLTCRRKKRGSPIVGSGS